MITIYVPAVAAYYGKDCWQSDLDAILGDLQNAWRWRQLPGRVEFVRAIGRRTRLGVCAHEWEHPEESIQAARRWYQATLAEIRKRLAECASERSGVRQIYSFPPAVRA